MKFNNSRYFHQTRRSFGYSSLVCHSWLTSKFLSRLCGVSWPSSPFSCVNFQGLWQLVRIIFSLSLKTCSLSVIMRYLVPVISARPPEFDLLTSEWRIFRFLPP